MRLVRVMKHCVRLVTSVNIAIRGLSNPSMILGDFCCYYCCSCRCRLHLHMMHIIVVVCRRWWFRTIGRRNIDYFYFWLARTKFETYYVLCYGNFVKYPFHDNCWRTWLSITLQRIHGFDQKISQKGSSFLNFNWKQIRKVPVKLFLLIY